MIIRKGRKIMVRDPHSFFPSCTWSSRALNAVLIRGWGGLGCRGRVGGGGGESGGVPGGWPPQPQPQRTGPREDFATGWLMKRVRICSYSYARIQTVFRGSAQVCYSWGRPSPQQECFFCTSLRLKVSSEKRFLRY